MKLEITPLPELLPTKIDRAHPDFLSLMTEEGVRKMVNDHYNLLRKSSIAHLFPQSNEAFEQAKKHSADFFVQVLGGYPYYNENRGNPMLRKRHMPFTITADARIVWLECYRNVLSELKIPEQLIKSFWNYLDQFSMMMVNSN